jgi:hypothetical protein
MHIETRSLPIEPKSAIQPNRPPASTEPPTLIALGTDLSGIAYARNEQPQA